MTDCTKLLREFVNKYRARITQGLATYGEFVAATDTRVMSSEAIAEILDVGSYMEFLEEMHPALKPKIRKIEAKAVILYGMLKELEADELALIRSEKR